jgi:hypothetical protein
MEEERSLSSGSLKVPWTRSESESESSLIHCHVLYSAQFKTYFAPTVLVSDTYDYISIQKQATPPPRRAGPLRTYFSKKIQNGLRFLLA